MNVGNNALWLSMFSIDKHSDITFFDYINIENQKSMKNLNTGLRERNKIRKPFAAGNGFFILNEKQNKCK